MTNPPSTPAHPVLMQTMSAGRARSPQGGSKGDVVSFEKRYLVSLSVFSLCLGLLGAACATTRGAVEPVDEASQAAQPYCRGFRPRNPGPQFQSCASRCELAHNYCVHGIAPGTARPRAICNRERRSCCARCASAAALTSEVAEAEE